MRISDWSSDVCSSDLVELLKGLGDGGLVGDRHHAHPAAEHTHLVDGVEALRAAGDLHHRACPALRRPYRADRKGNPVDLRLHHRAHCAVPLRPGPDLAFRPERALSQLMHFRMPDSGDVRPWLAIRLEDASFLPTDLPQDLVP